MEDGELHSRSWPLYPSLQHPGLGGGRIIFPRVVCGSPPWGEGSQIIEYRDCIWIHFNAKGKINPHGGIFWRAAEKQNLLSRFFF